VLPDMDAATGLLPAAPDPYLATLEEVRQRFVDEAPYSAEREVLFDALALYARVVWRLLPDARLRIDGGFVTHKAWAPPEDVDIAVVCPTITSAQLDEAVNRPLFTVLGVQGKIVGLDVRIPKSHVMGGLVDAFPVLPFLPKTDGFFRRLWSTVYDENKNVVPGLAKGYVEVVNPDAGP
jgi:hypothetical protein